MSIFDDIIHIFTKKECCACFKVWHSFCAECLNRLKIYEKKIQYGQKSKISEINILFSYDSIWLKTALHKGKYYKLYPVYNDILSVWDAVLQKFIQTENSLLVPVPMHFLRKWKRWYNHSEKIARYISKRYGIPVDSTLIKKIKNTKQQSKLSKIERQKNLQESFKVSKKALDYWKTIYIIDDVMSTWATIEEIWKVLSEAGYKDIRAIILSSN